jgi:6-phosphogluconolactonase
MTAPKQRLYVGTYTDRKTPSEGIYLCEFDPAAASLAILGATQSENPSFLALSADRRFLYAVNETSEFEGIPGGGVSAYAVDAESGALTLLNAQPTHGDHPCHILIDASGGWAFVSNYSGGSLTVLPILPDGTLGAPSVIQHHGSGLDKERQASAHVHSTLFDPLGRLLVADLGMDAVVIYQFDPVSGTLTPDGAIPMTPGMGPRHMAFTPDGHFFYVIGELNGTVAAFSFDPASGQYEPIQTIPTLPPEHSFKECADLHVAPDGKFLYGSNRGKHDSIVGYGIDPISGQLALVGYFPTGGAAPRNFGFDLSGEFVLAANQQSDSITVFRADAGGRLVSTGQSLTIPVPVCVQAFV